jgi:hypothetical protein
MEIAGIPSWEIGGVVPSPDTSESRLIYDLKSISTGTVS